MFAYESQLINYQVFIKVWLHRGIDKNIVYIAAIHKLLLAFCNGKA